MPMRIDAAKENAEVLGTGFNHDYFTDAVRTMESDRFYLGFKNAVSSVSFSGSPFDGVAATKATKAPAKLKIVTKPVAPVFVEEDYAYLKRWA
jgi:DNA polymerase III sliding clamp (beta) subunit (PCNA family)